MTSATERCEWCGKPAAFHYVSIGTRANLMLRKYEAALCEHCADVATSAMKMAQFTFSSEKDGDAR